MELLLLFLLSSSTLAICLLFFKSKKKPLPPGPPAVPIIGNLIWLRQSISNLEQILNDLHAKYGPIVTVRIGSILAIFISDHSLAHKALVEYGSIFSHRPAPLPALRFLTSNQYNISSAGYGPLWRLFRRNITIEILNPTKVSLFAPSREWVLDLLLRDLNNKSKESSDGSVVAIESFQFAMFSLLVLMCFGEKLDEKDIREIETAHNNLLFYLNDLNVFSFVPRIAKYVFRQRWKTCLELKQKQKDVFIPLIRARKARKESEGIFVHAYVDTLLDIKLSEENNRRLTEDELVSLCSEFLTAGTDTTATALQWIMAELVKYKSVQVKLLEEIEHVVGDEGIKEEDLENMHFLKAVILEGLRLHPPGHFVLPHAVTEDVEFEGYYIPKNASINFFVAQMGWDEKMWKEPMKFKPERFMPGGDGDGVDITGSREIKMMPFGVGRRICPGLKLASLHLEYFVSNLVREFEWDVIDGEEVDLSEKLHFTTMMKNPLKVRLLPRIRA